MGKYKRLVLTVILAAVFMSGCGEKEPAESTPVQSGQENPDTSSQEEEAVPVVFEAMDLEGNEVSSDVFSETKLTMINVWGTFCGPCLREMPDLGELAGEYEPEEFRLIGIISDVQEGDTEEKISLAESLIEETGADFTHLLLNESLYLGLLTGVSGVPTTFFVDENGIVVYVVQGAKDKEMWQKIINGLLEEL